MYNYDNLIYYILLLFYYIHLNNNQNINKYIKFSGCPTSGTTTASKPRIHIELSNGTANWPEDSAIKIKQGGIVIFHYKPFTDSTDLKNTRFEIKRDSFRKDFILLIEFKPEKDAGEEFEIGYLPSQNQDDFYLICRIFVNDDLTPKAVLTMRAPPELGVREQGSFKEGDRVIIQCQIFKMIDKRNFTIVFPQGAEYQLIEGQKDRKKYTLLLTRNIKNKNISCYVDGGYNTTKTDFLYFQNKIPTTTPKSKTTIAISISVLFALMLCIMLPVGAYMLIIKQRKDNTKQMVEHHAQEAQTRMQTQLTQMSRMSRMSRMSKMSQMQPPENG